MNCIKINLNDFYEEEVVSIEDGIDYTFDVEVEDEHHYILDNGIISHNTTSLSIGNNCSSGIEPVFALEYTRNVKQPNDTFLPQNVYSRTYLMWKELFGDKELPESFITADKIPLEASVNIQQAFQNNIDASISKTLTLPDDFSYEDYQGLLMQAWEKKLKGMTTYNPNGSLAPILSTKKEEKPEDKFWEEVKVLPNSKKRPVSLPCDIYEMQVNKQRVVVLVGKDVEENVPYEVFLTVDEDALIKLGSAKEGEIAKTGKGTYDLVIHGKKSTFILEDITSVFDDDYAIMCRLLSLAMRHHIPLQFIVDQLNKTKRFDTFSKTMAKVLKKYISEGEAVISRSEVCPECQGKLHFVEGCKTCPNCGWSKC